MKTLILVCQLLALVLVGTACTKKEADVRLNVKVRTNQGDTVDGAEVTLEGKVVGATNNFGVFQTAMKLPLNTRVRLEVKKDSDLYYFAPYFENFAVTEAATQDFTVDATLYFVPKPEPELAAKAAQKTVDGKDTPHPGAAPPDAEQAANAGAPQTRAPQTRAPETKVPEVEAPAPETPAVDEPATEAMAEATAAEHHPSEAADLQQSAADESIGTAAQSAGEGVATTKQVADLDAAAIKQTAPPQDLEPVVTGETDLAATASPDTSIFTIHVQSNEVPVAAAQVSYGEDADGDLKLGCNTNVRGRCVVRFQEKPEGPVTFVVAKEGYRTKTTSTAVGSRGSLRVQLDRGQTIDVYALTKTYNYTSGLKDVEVFVGGKRVGVTNRFGHYAHFYAGKPEDLVTVSLKPLAYLPETYESDFVVSGPMRLVRYFSPFDPPPVRVSIIGAQLAGDIDQKAIQSLGLKLDESIKSAARRHIFSSAAFKEFPASLLAKGARRAKISIPTLLRSGWQSSELKAVVDAVLVPTIVSGAAPALEVSLVDSKARILSAASEPLDSFDDKASIDRAMAVVAKKLARSFPFEGAVLAKDGDVVTINLGYGSGRGIKPGDVLDVSGVQITKTGRTQTHKHVATLVIKEVSDSSAKTTVTSLAPRASIERGDLVVLRPRKVQTPAAVQIRVTGNVKVVGQDPLPQANVYFNDQWIGATDDQGRLYSGITGSGSLKVIKLGYQQYSKSVSLAANAKLDVAMRRESAFLRVESQPPQVNVKVDGRLVGKTPLKAPIPVPSGFLKLELDAPSGFKPYHAVLELDQGTLDLSGPNAIQLEPDYLASARRLHKSGRLEEALAKYAEVPPDHSDYLQARHEAGEIYLTELDQPAKAAEAFGAVTSDDAVKQFSDKRFIGSHIDEGVALFLTGEKLAASKPEAARAHYKKAISIFDNVVSQLRFVPAEQYSQAVHNVDFHRALARHKLWMIAKEPRLLSETVRTWRSYLDGSARSVPAEGAAKSYVENAEVYFKQAIASQGPSRGVSRQ